MKIQLIGSGNRARAYATYLKEQIAYVCDPVTDRAELLIEKFGIDNAEVYEDYRLCPDADGIIIAVPDYMHEEVFGWAVEKNVPILLEKPVSVSNESLESMMKTTEDFNSSVILGFTLRYTKMYSGIFTLIDEGVIGKIISLEASETLDPLHAAKFFRRWHRFTKNSGGFLNTKCSHDMDIINLMMPGRLKSLASFGSNSIFIPGKGQDVCDETCPEYSGCRYVDKNDYQFSTADIKICPYNIESDIIDHQVVSMEFDSGATAVFTVSMHSDKGNRKIHIHGTKGSIAASFEDQKIHLFTDGNPERVIEPEEVSGSHGGGDKYLCEKFVDRIETGSTENQLAEGVTASAMALAADASRKTGKVIDMRTFAAYMY